MRALATGTDVEIARLVAAELPGVRFRAGGGGVPDAWVGANGLLVSPSTIRKMIYAYDGAIIGAYAADYCVTTEVAIDAARADSVLRILADLLSP